MIAQDNWRAGSIRCETALFRKCLFPPSAGIVEHHDRGIEHIRIERSAEPPPHLLVIWVLRVANGQKKLFIAADAPAVLGRAGARTVDASWITRQGIARDEAFVSHFVLPVIAEVVHIQGRGHLRRDVPGYRHLPTSHAGMLVWELRVRNTNPQFTLRLQRQTKLVEMTILPPHGVLNRYVKIQKE